MRLPRFTTLELLLAATLIALMLGLFTAAWRHGAPDEICQFCLSPGEKHLAARFKSGHVRVWRIDGVRPRLVARAFGTAPKPKEHHWLMECMYFVDDDRLLKLESYQLNRRVNVRELNLASGKVTDILQIPQPFAQQGWVAVDSSRLFIAQWGTPNVWCYDVKQRQFEREFAVGTEHIWSLALSADGSRLIVHDFKGTVHVVDAATGASQATLPDIPIEINSMALSPDGSQIIAPGSKSSSTRAPSSGALTSLVSFDAKTGAAPSDWLTTLKSRAIWVEMSRDGQWLAVCDQPDATEFYHLPTKKRVRTITHDQLRAASAFLGLSQFKLTPDGKSLLVASGNQIMCWDIATGKLVRTIGGSESRLVPIAIFLGGFAFWSVAWGIVRKRSRESFAVISQPAPVYDLRERLPTPFTPPPLAMRLCWGLMIAGGLVALAIPIGMMFIAGPWLFPTLYFSLLVGIAAIGRGAAGDSTRLRRLAMLQLANMIALDLVNVVFAAMEYALLRTDSAQDYLRTRAADLSPRTATTAAALSS
jgi:hypothetical protein